MKNDTQKQMIPNVYLLYRKDGIWRPTQYRRLPLDWLEQSNSWLDRQHWLFRVEEHLRGRIAGQQVTIGDSL